MEVISSAMANKQSRNKFTKGVRDVYTENYKALMKLRGLKETRRLPTVMDQKH